MPTYQGKIGILPERIREELNHRILDGQPGSKILPWLNALPEVQKLLKENDEGLNVSDNNLSNWRNGGFADWRRRREQIDRIREMSKWSMRLAKESGGNLTEGAAAILSGRILQVLEGVDALLNPDQSDAARSLTPEQFAAVTASIADLSESLASLRAGDQNQRRIKQYDERTRLLEQKLDIAEKQLTIAEKQLALAEKQLAEAIARGRRQAFTKFQEWVGEARVQAILAGAGNTDAKTEKLGELIFGEDWQ